MITATEALEIKNNSIQTTVNELLKKIDGIIKLEAQQGNTEISLKNYRFWEFYSISNERRNIIIDCLKVELRKLGYITTKVYPSWYKCSNLIISWNEESTTLYPFN